MNRLSGSCLVFLIFFKEGRSVWEPAPLQVLLHYADETNGKRQHDFVQVSSQWKNQSLSIARTIYIFDH